VHLDHNNKVKPNLKVKVKVNEEKISDTSSHALSKSSSAMDTSFALEPLFDD
jgi:hypothetical protein